MVKKRTYDRCVKLADYRIIIDMYNGLGCGRWMYDKGRHIKYKKKKKISTDCRHTRF